MFAQTNTIKKWIISEWFSWFLTLKNSFENQILVLSDASWASHHKLHKENDAINYFVKNLNSVGNAKLCSKTWVMLKSHPPLPRFIHDPKHSFKMMRIFIAHWSWLCGKTSHKDIISLYYRPMPPCAKIWHTFLKIVLNICICRLGGVKSLVSRYIEGYSFWSIWGP